MTNLSKFKVYAVHCNDDTSDVGMWCERAGCDSHFGGQWGETVLLSELVEVAESHARDAHPELTP